MPFTPIHMGPGMVIKAALPRRFSLVVFGLTQVAIDTEVLWHMARRDTCYHTFFHTFLGATCVAAAISVFGKPVSQWIKRLWNCVAIRCSNSDVTVETHTSWTAAIWGAAIGAYSHVVLDSIYHANMDAAPLQPWSAANPFLGWIAPEWVEIWCVLAGIVGLIWYFGRTIRPPAPTDEPGKNS